MVGAKSCNHQTSMKRFLRAFTHCVIVWNLLCLAHLGKNCKEGKTVHGTCPSNKVMQAQRISPPDEVMRTHRTSPAYRVRQTQRTFPPDEVMRTRVRASTLQQCVPQELASTSIKQCCAPHEQELASTSIKQLLTPEKTNIYKATINHLHISMLNRQYTIRFKYSHALCIGKQQSQVKTRPEQ